MPPVIENPQETLAAIKTRAQELQQLQPEVDADTLANPPGRVNVPTPRVGSLPDNSGMLQGVRNNLTFTLEDFQANQARRNELFQEQQSLAGEGTLSDLFQQQQEEFQIPQNIQELRDIQLQLADRGTETELKKSRIQEGNSLSQAQREVTQTDREAAIRDAGLAARASVLSDNIQTAQAAAAQAVNIAYQDRTLKATNLINQINSVQSILGEQRSEILEQDRRQYEEEQAHIERVKNAVDSAVVSGAATADEIALLTKPTVVQGENEPYKEFIERAQRADQERYQTALSIIGRKATADYNLERAIKGRQYEKLGLEIQSVNQKAAAAAAAAAAGTLTEEQFSVANDLRKEVNNLQEVKDAKDLEANTASLLSALQQENGVGDISAINSFQRLVVDPGVAVREGDVALLQTAQSWTDETWLKAQGLMKGDKLTPKARTQMEDLVRDVYNIRTDLVDMNTQQVRTIAQEQGIDYGKYIGRNYQTFEQLKSGITPQEDGIFGIDTDTGTYLDSIVGELANDPTANPFGVDLSQ